MGEEEKMTVWVSARANSVFKWYAWDEHVEGEEE